jgi:hypothetical protein
MLEEHHTLTIQQYSSKQNTKVTTLHDHGSMAYIVPCIISFIHICVDLFSNQTLALSVLFTILVIFLLLIKRGSGCTAVIDWKAGLCIKFLHLVTEMFHRIVVTVVAMCDRNLWN